jgi:hypothetical protein
MSVCGDGKVQARGSVALTLQVVNTCSDTLVVICDEIQLAGSWERNNGAQP